MTFHSEKFHFASLAVPATSLSPSFLSLYGSQQKNILGVPAGSIILATWCFYPLFFNTQVNRCGESQNLQLRKSKQSLNIFFWLFINITKICIFNKFLGAVKNLRYISHYRNIQIRGINFKLWLHRFILLVFHWPILHKT